MEECLPCGENASLYQCQRNKGGGVCDVNTFRGISLTSVVSKALCKILESRLSGMGENQILSLVLLGQAEMVKWNDGMLVAFIDFSKAHD